MSNWTSIKLSGKLTEVKDVVNPKTKSHLVEDQAELYACLRIDNLPDLQFKTAPVTCAFPMWAEDFEFHLKHGFRQVEIVVWAKIHSTLLSPTEASGSVIPLGKVYISKDSVKNNDETWYSLRDASLETRVSGRINLKIEHFGPNMQRKIHGFSVTVFKAADLYCQNSFPNPFVVLHMVPDLDALTAETTTVKNSTNNPMYSEAFFFSCDENQDPSKKILFASVWDKSSQGDVNFLGLCEIPLAQVITKGVSNRWYHLSALSDDSIYTRTLKSKYNNDDSAPARELIKELQKVDQRVRVRKAHTFKDKNVALAKCLHCDHKMVGMHLFCSQCHLYCHFKCREEAGYSCGGNGSIRLSLAIEKTTVLALDDYYDLIDTLQSNRYGMLLEIGKNLSEKLEISKYCQSIFGNQFFDFLVLVIQGEIRNSDSTKTLFRGNTLASKAIYTFMTQIGIYSS
jgi:C2 domain